MAFIFDADLFAALALAGTFVGCFWGNGALTLTLVLLPLFVLEGSSWSLVLAIWLLSWLFDTCWLFDVYSLSMSMALLNGEIYVFELLLVIVTTWPPPWFAAVPFWLEKLAVFFGGAGVVIGLKCLNEGALDCTGITFGSGKLLNKISELMGLQYFGSCSLLATACKTSCIC